ncbi:MAG TPA: thymidylate synthase [Candidatus Competibacteraceae bacterium]|nr:thymidylate synthase [Candidatus Competibacteraceae bacterium]
MRQYLDLLRYVLNAGTWQENRTGIRTLSIPGAMLRFDLLNEGFPAITTRKLAFKSAMGELVGFLRAARHASDFRALGCKVWDQNANENPQWLANPYRSGTDDLGDIYGVQWRRWPAYKVLEAVNEAQIEDAQKRGFRLITRFSEDGRDKVLLYKAVDQLRQCLDTIMTDPTARRILFHGWNLAQLDQMALPPCHLLYQFLPNVARKELSLCLYIRSNDLGLGAGFNLAEGAALLHLVGRLTGLTPRWFSYMIGDAHIYENQLDMLREQLQREPYPPPRLVLNERIPEYAKTGLYEPEWLDNVEPDDFRLEGYQHHPPLMAPMAV